MATFSVQLLSLFNTLAAFFGGIAWHLFRIATLRPRFDKLSAKPITVGTFFVVYLVCGLLRWAVVGDRVPSAVFISLLVHASILWAFLKTSRYSICLLVSMLGASAVIDLVGMALQVSGIYFSDKTNMPFYAIELGLYAVCYIRYLRHVESSRMLQPNGEKHV